MPRKLTDITITSSEENPNRTLIDYPSGGGGGMFI
jgi:hypothetical protein